MVLRCSRLIYCSADWPRLELPSFLTIRTTLCKSVFSKSTQCIIVQPCLVPFQPKPNPNPRLGCMYSKWWLNQWQGLWIVFSFLCHGSKVEIGRRQHLTKVPSNRKECKCPTWRFKALVYISSNWKIWWTLQSDFSQLSILAINVRWKQHISTLSCLKTCHKILTKFGQILTNEWWRSSNISSSHTKSMLLLKQN